MIYVSKPSIISSAGMSADENLANLQSGRRFLSVCDGFNQSKNFIVGMVKGELPKFASNTPEHFRTRTNALVLNALEQIDDAALKAIKKYGKSRVAVVIGTTTSGVEENYETFKQYAKNGVFDKSKFGISRSSLANPAEFISYHYGLNSPVFSVSTACTSGVKALIEAKRLINSRLCDAVICGGVDSLNTLTINGFDSLGILSQNPSVPFSKNRDGINIGEGAGLFVLSRDEISDVVVAGEHSNCDAFHVTQPDLNGQMQGLCMKKALDMAGLSDVDYLNLHGTGTFANDKMEARIVNSLLKDTPASSIKPAIGHTLGAAGAIESAICALLCTKGESVLPPHIYDGVYDDELERIDLIKQGQKAVVNAAMSISFAFGGDNAAIVFRRLK